MPQEILDALQEIMWCRTDSLGLQIQFVVLGVIWDVINKVNYLDNAILLMYSRRELPHSLWHE